MHQKDGMRLKEMFNQVFMESVYPLYSLADLESYSVADTQQQVMLLLTLCT